jgi:hypothetical protein
MPLSGPQNRCGAVFWPATHREVLACMLLFGSALMNTAYLYRPWAMRLWWRDPKAFYQDSLDKHYADAFMKDFRTCTFFIEAKVKRGGRKMHKIIRQMQQVELPKEAEFFFRNPENSLKSFPPCYSQSRYSIAFRFLFLQTHATSYSFYSYCTL